MTAPRSLVLSGIALAAALASMPSHAGWLSNLWGSGGSQTGVSYDDSWSDAAGTATAPATSMTTSPTATPKPTLTARPARTVADSTGTVALTGVEQRWKKPIEDSGKMLRSEIPAIVGSQQAGYAPAWSSFFIGQTRCVKEWAYHNPMCYTIRNDGSFAWTPPTPYFSYGMQTDFSMPTPFGYEPVEVVAINGHSCSFDAFRFVASPIFDKLRGGIPSGWTLKSTNSVLRASNCN